MNRPSWQTVPSFITVSKYHLSEKIRFLKDVYSEHWSCHETYVFCRTKGFWSFIRYYHTAAIGRNPNPVSDCYCCYGWTAVAHVWCNENCLFIRAERISLVPDKRPFRALLHKEIGKICCVELKDAFHFRFPEKMASVLSSWPVCISILHSVWLFPSTITAIWIIVSCNMASRWCSKWNNDNAGDTRNMATSAMYRSPASGWYTSQEYPF